jgi:hypothetical protein
MRRFLVDLVWARLELPATLIVVHFAVSLLAVGSLYVSEIILVAMQLGTQEVPLLKITLGNLMVDLEIFASAGIIIAGMLEALVLLFFGIILECVVRAREIATAWRS